MIAAPLLAKGSGLDWSRDFAPLGKVGRVPFALAVHPVPAQTVAELVRHARQHPGVPQCRHQHPPVKCWPSCS